MRQTLNNRMIEVRNRSSGFDYLRVSLATAIILWHTVPTSYGAAAQFQTPLLLRMFVMAILPMFFSLSGFLVSGSLDRSPSLVTFYGLRLLRIVPALAAEVTLSALILGTAFSTFSAASYFTDPEFRIYFLNMLGYIHFFLPGMFLGNPVPGVVNLQLWTIPYELECYLVIGVLAFLRVIKNRMLLLILLVVVQLVFAIHGFHGAQMTGRVTVGGRMLVLAFIFGVALNSYKDKIPFNGFIAALSAILMLASLSFGPTRYLCGLPSAYLTIYLGLLNPPRLPLIFSGDYSYGLYLYGFPIQQAVASFPSLRHWYINFAIAYPLALFCAVGSWWLLEKRALSFRRYLSPRKPRPVVASSPVAVADERLAP
jgi:peptidoglycan/LPS O-acetylase OafA/YrhL